MIKPINAIRLRKRMEIICDRTCPYLESKNKYTMCAACPLDQAFLEVDEAPEVIAIPIEWARNWALKNWVKSKKCEYDIIISKMIDDWREENETDQR